MRLFAARPIGYDQFLILPRGHRNATRRQRVAHPNAQWKGSLSLSQRYCNVISLDSHDNTVRKY